MRKTPSTHMPLGYLPCSNRHMPRVSKMSVAFCAKRVLVCPIYGAANRLVDLHMHTHMYMHMHTARMSPPLLLPLPPHAHIHAVSVQQHASRRGDGHVGTERTGILDNHGTEWAATCRTRGDSTRGPCLPLGQATAVSTACLRVVPVATWKQREAGPP